MLLSYPNNQFNLYWHIYIYKEICNLKKESWFMGACQIGWSPTNHQARDPSITQSGKCVLLRSASRLKQYPPL